MAEQDVAHAGVCGNTAMPFARIAHGRMVVNPGSVGMPYGRSGAHWALLGPGVDLRCTGFDIVAACDVIIRVCEFPGITGWVDAVLRHPATDAEALAHFRG
ncbi:hypothetical protein [Actinokineospora sp. NPDC004072]